MNLVIKNANLLGNNLVDIKIQNEKIKEIGKDLYNDQYEVFDADGKIVIPGGVDVHTHFTLDLGKYIAVDDFYTGSVAAAHGGTTTIVDHISFGNRGTSVSDMVNKYHIKADGNAIIDYSFHGAIQEVNDIILDEFESLYNEGIVSTKIYTTYGGKIDDSSILKVLQKAKEVGTVVCVHCENDGMILELRYQAQKAGHNEPIYHAYTRPDVTEAEAINRLSYLSELAGDPTLYIVHTSTEAGLNEIKAARARGLKNIHCETCTQYLLLDESKLIDGGNSEGIKYICAPPLRKKSDNEALWEGIIKGDVEVVATDHCPFFYEKEKLPFKDDFYSCPGGIPGVEERVELILTEGMKRGISMERLIEVLVENPAKIFGMYPKKGILSPGSDADIVILEEKPYTITQSNRHSKVDYTTYEGFASDFKVNTVLSRGQFLIKNNDYVANKGQGKFIKRIFK